MNLKRVKRMVPIQVGERTAYEVEVQDDHVVDFAYSGRGDLTDEERNNIFWLWNEVNKFVDEIGEKNESH